MVSIPNSCELGRIGWAWGVPRDEVMITCAGPRIDRADLTGQGSAAIRMAPGFAEQCGEADHSRLSRVVVLRRSIPACGLQNAEMRDRRGSATRSHGWRISDNLNGPISNRGLPPQTPCDRRCWPPLRIGNGMVTLRCVQAPPSPRPLRRWPASLSLERMPGSRRGSRRGVRGYRMADDVEARLQPPSGSSSNPRSDRPRNRSQVIARNSSSRRDGRSSASIGRSSY